MAIGHNLISCDDVLYPSLFNRHSLSLPPLYSSTVEFDSIPNEYYTVEKSNQAFFPYPDISGEDAFVVTTLTSISFNSVEIFNTPTVINSATEVRTDITGGAANPPVFSTDYVLSWLKDTNYISGSTYGTGVTDAIQNAFDSQGIDTVIVRRTSKQPQNSSGTPVSFVNFCIHKREEDSVVIRYTVEYNPSAGPVVTNNVLIEFTGTTSSYKVDTVETTIAGNLAQEYETDTSALRLFDFTFETFEEKDCPCELCDNCYLLTNCSDKTIWMRTYSDLSESLGQVVELEEIEGCWLVEECVGKIEVTVKETYVHCKSCQPKCYTPKCN